MTRRRQDVIYGQPVNVEEKLKIEKMSGKHRGTCMRADGCDQALVSIFNSIVEHTQWLNKGSGVYARALLFILRDLMVCCFEVNIK